MASHQLINNAKQIASQSPVIEVLGLRKDYGGVAAVAGIDLTVAEGEFLSILGPSGSGKSTLLGLIAGLVQPTGGRIMIGSRDVTLVPPAQRDIGLVFQSYALFPNMTVAGNIAFPLAVRGANKRDMKARVEWVIDLVRLNGLENRKPSQLSGGQQQRVAIARAVVFGPRLLLLDEPLAALDRKLRDEVRVELRRLQRTLGVTTVLVTHDQDEAMSTSDRIAVLAQGLIQQIATPAELYRQPANRFVAGFLGIANLLEGVVAREGDDAVLTLDGGMKLPLPSGNALPGSRATMVVRPERIDLKPATDARTSRFGIDCEVVDVVYHGEVVRYTVQAQPIGTVIASCQHVVPRFSPGDHVCITWRPEDGWLLQESEK
ncbi:ABC transporter ATP-binding protein [Mesorhizobium sp. LSHC412B00]|uniref:ABC transporter ATP-binding protein n=1 Tax=Mesorhizobium sp. LSHC412B00 TaxID=1287285 RepID=UPI0004CDF481|nr:ABC transporter ATP-binding protein [Mesorhizobium sp. LSHC412B00]